MNKNETTNTPNQFEQQMKMMMASPVFRKAMKDAEAYYNGKKQELQLEKGMLQVHKDAVARMMLGLHHHRNASFVKMVDGNLIKVITDDFANVKNISSVKSFNDLSLAEKTQLYTSDKKMYKLLELDLYQPKATERLVDLLILDDSGMKYEEFDMIASIPSRPDLSTIPLGSIEATNLVREYEVQKEVAETNLANYRNDVKLYHDGFMNDNIRQSEEKIKSLEEELK